VCHTASLPEAHVMAQTRSISTIDESDLSLYGIDPRLLVGSPEQIPPLGVHQIPRTSSQLAHTPSSRPSLEHRSASAPHGLGLLTTHRGTDAARRITSGLMRLTPGTNAGGQTASDREWTLFGQLMENEGQLRSPGSQRIKRKPSHAAISRSDISSAGNLSASTTDPFLDRIVQQSPTAEARLGTTDHPVRESQSAPFQEFSTDYESDSSTSSVTSVPDSVAQTSHWFAPRKLSAVPILHQNILKCGIAYFIASLFTFSPPLSGIISDITSYGPGKRAPAPSGHMVATVSASMRMMNRLIAHAYDPIQCSLLSSGPDNGCYGRSRHVLPHGSPLFGLRVPGQHVDVLVA
jgi:hypothetical protein